MAGGTFTIVRCETCGFLFQNPRPGAKLLERLYAAGYGPHTEAARDGFEVYNKGAGALDRWKNRVKRAAFSRKLGYPATEPVSFGCGLAAAVFGRRILRAHYRLPRWKPGGRVLEIGCGPGYFLEVLKRFGWRPVGLEWDPGLAERASRNAGAPVLVGLESLRAEPDGEFDAVVLWHVLEHLPDPVGALREFRRLLKPGGELRLVVPNTASLSAAVLRVYWPGIAEPRHFSHFTKKTLRAALERAGWKSFRITSIPSRGCWASSLGYRARSLGRPAPERPWYEGRPAAALFSCLSRAASWFGGGDFLLAEGWNL